MSFDRGIAFSVFLLLLTNSAHAQFDYCKQILSDGIWDIRSGSNTSSYQKSYVNWFCSQNFSSETSFKDKSASLKIPIDGVPVQIGGHSRSNDWRSYYNAACSMQDEYISQLNKSEFFTKVANTDVVRAWETCVGSANVGLKMTHYTTSSPTIFRVDFAYRSNRTPADIAILSKLIGYQANKDGAIKPLACQSIDQKLDQTGSVTNVEVPDNSKVSFTCQRNVCSTAFVEVKSNVVVMPDSKIEIQPAVDACAPPSIPNCTKYNLARDACYRCDFTLDEKGAQFAFHDRICTNMPENQLVKVKFSGGYTVANRGAGSDCWLAERMKAADGSSPDRKDHTNVVACSTSVSRETEFLLPKNKGQAIGGIQVEQCQWGGNANMQCDLKGVLSIFTAHGQ